MLSRLVLSVALAACLSCSGLAWAQHEGDVEFAYHDGHIDIETGELSLIFGTKLFEGAFPTSGGFVRFTQDPGFDAHDGIGAGDVIGFTLHSAHHGHFLNYFDPTTGSIASAHPWSINYDWGPDDLDISSSLGGSGFVGQADGSGFFHIHNSFTLSAGTPIGAYGFVMSLNTSAAGIADSDPFWVVFNFGMSTGDFEVAVRKFTGIPEPSSLAMLGLAFTAMAGWSRRRR